MLKRGKKFVAYVIGVLIVVRGAVVQHRTRPIAVASHKAFRMHYDMLTA